MDKSTFTNLAEYVVNTQHGKLNQKNPDQRIRVFLCQGLGTTVRRGESR
ncbi:MAG: hypothetical protein WD035_09710 [Balneolaceae bacterium]